MTEYDLEIPVKDSLDAYSASHNIAEYASRISDVCRPHGFVSDLTGSLRCRVSECRMNNFCQLLLGLT